MAIVDHKTHSMPDRRLLQLLWIIALLNVLHLVDHILRGDFHWPIDDQSIGFLVVATVILGGMAGYGLSRFHYRWGPWRNKEIAFWFISQRMLPPAAAILAFMVMFKYLHLLDSVAGLAIAYTGFNLPFAIWIMRDFFLALPRELEESSLVEGAGWFTTFWRIVLPLSVPGLAATGILLFIFSWNEYLFASLLAFEKAKTMPVTIAGMATAIGIRWWLMSALAIVSMVPTVLLGLVLERYIVRGLTAGAIK